MKKWMKKLFSYAKQLRTQLFIAYFFVFTFFFCSIFTLVNGSIRNLLIQQIGSNRVAILQQIGERANIIKTSSITLSNLYSHEILSNQFLTKSISDEATKDAYQYLDSQKEIYDEIFQRIGLNYQVILVANNGFSYYSNKLNIDMNTWMYQPWYKHLIASLQTGNAGEVQFSRTFSSSSKDGIVYQFAAGQLLNVGNIQAILLILIDEQLLEELYHTVQEPGGEIYIYDQNGFIVSHSNKKMLGKQFIDVDYMKSAYGVNQSVLIQKLHTSYMLSNYLDEKTGWTIVEESPTKIILETLDHTDLMIGITLIISLILALVVSLYLSHRISHPLVQLSHAMDKFGHSDFLHPNIKNGTEEIDHLQESFHHMANEIMNLLGIIQEREQQKRMLEVNFLRAQINPHFLYNTLFSIRCAIEVGKTTQATQMLSAFIDLLRSTLSVKNTTISLQEELDTTRKYLIVQKLRYGEKIHFEIEIQEETQHCMIPPLILQPLVENAIFHGIEAKGENGTIIVETALIDNDLLLTITDDGAGMSSETLNHIRTMCDTPSIRHTSSIGIANVHNRIRLNYGRNYGLWVESEIGIGTTVTLRMPAIILETEGNESI